MPDQYWTTLPGDGALRTWSGARNDVARAAEYLREEKKVGRLAVLGFCMGGALAWMSCAELDFQTTVLYYPHDVFGSFGADGAVAFDRTPKLKAPVPSFAQC